METEYVRTEYDRITQPIVDRFSRISRERGREVIPLSVTGEPAECHRQQYERDHRDEPIVEDDAVGADRDQDSDGTHERGFLGFRRFGDQE